MTGNERVIYSNYDLWDDYAENAKESLHLNGVENPTEQDIWDEIYELDSIVQEDVFSRLEDFFNDESWILFGECELWNRKVKGSIIFSDFLSTWLTVTKDCLYYKIYDVNGHFYIRCSHHDGTNQYEIKKLTEKAVTYYDNWGSNYNTSKREAEIHEQIIKKYSTLPHFAHKVYGCAKREYEKTTA